MTRTLHLGDCRTVMATLDDNSIAQKRIDHYAVTSPLMEL
jgi:hypothetical protein